MRLFLITLLAAISYAQTEQAVGRRRRRRRRPVNNAGNTLACGNPITGQTTEDEHSMTFPFTADTPNYIFDTCSTDWDTMLTVLDSNGNEIHFNDDHSNDCENGNNQLSSHLETELQTGEQYSLQINGYCATCFGPFTISVSCLDPCAGSVCPRAVCGDGSSAPIPEGECCGDASLCPVGSVLADSGSCPAGYTLTMTELECFALMNYEVKESSYHAMYKAPYMPGPTFLPACSGGWTPANTCYAKPESLTMVYVTKDCGQSGSFKNKDVMCKREDCAGFACPSGLCSDGSPPPVPEGSCCPDPALCPVPHVTADDSGRCPSGYSTTMTELQCYGLVGSEINGRVVTFGQRGQAGYWPPINTCFVDEKDGKLYYAIATDRQVPKYDEFTVICNPDSGAAIALESKNEAAVAAFEVIDSTYNAVTIFACIGVMSLMYHGAKKIHKVVFGATDFKEINEAEC